MKMFNVIIPFFTLCVLDASPGFAQSSRGFLNADSLLAHGTFSINSDGTLTLNGDTIRDGIEPLTLHGNLDMDSLITGSNGIITPDNPGSSSLHYFFKDDKRYYIENVPPTIKGKRIDDSNVWLLGAK